MPDREPRNPGAVWCASFVRESFGDLVIHLPIVISAMAWKFALVHLPGAVIGVAKSTIAAGSCGSLAVGTSGGPAAGSLACGGRVAVVAAGSHLLHGTIGHVLFAVAVKEKTLAAMLAVSSDTGDALVIGGFVQVRNASTFSIFVGRAVRRVFKIWRGLKRFFGRSKLQRLEKPARTAWPEAATSVGHYRLSP